MPESQPAAPILSRRLAAPPDPGSGTPFLRLALSADGRTRLRGQRRSLCGRDLLLQLERGEPLRPGEWLAGEAADLLVRVEAAPEPLLLVRAAEPLQLLQAAYHLGNRHVALEIRPMELRLLWDPVLAYLLEHRGLQLERREEPFLPEPGAYAAGHGHGANHGHDGPSHGTHGHGASPSQGPIGDGHGAHSHSAHGQGHQRPAEASAANPPAADGGTESPLPGSQRAFGTEPQP